MIPMIVVGVITSALGVLYLARPETLWRWTEGRFAGEGKTMPEDFRTRAKVRGSLYVVMGVIIALLPWLMGQ